jgi:hypothetical protein
MLFRAQYYVVCILFALLSAALQIRTLQHTTTHLVCLNEGVAIEQIDTTVMYVDILYSRALYNVTL